MPRINRYACLSDLTAVVLDLETTGLDVTSDRVVQVGAVRIDKGRLLRTETFESLVNPSIPIPPSSTAIHGIDDRAVLCQPRFPEIQPALDAFCGDAVIVGQSVGFDLAFLLRETRLMGARWRPPHFLDTKLLYAALASDQRELSLDDLAGVLGITLGHRHTALDDAMATAEIFIRLLPLLAEKGIRTLGDAEAHSNAQTRILEHQAREGWYDATSVRPSEAWIDGRDREALAPLDPFLYRQQLRHVMRSPVAFLPPQATILEAARRMDSGGNDAIVIGDPTTNGVWGVVTERDILRAFASDGAASTERRVESIMSEAVVFLPQDAFLYQGVARMQRRNIRHLIVTDVATRPVGVVSAYTLLGERAGQAIRLGDEISEASKPDDLARTHARLPAVARELLANGVDAVDIARVLSFELREMVGRAAVLAEQLMVGEGQGRPPAPYALFVLGSGGRGESLLSAEQDNALVYDSADTDGPTAAWFARFGAHIAAILDTSGVDDCADGVTVQNPSWRGNLDTWRQRFRHWANRPEQVLSANADLLFDGHLAYGNAELAAEYAALLSAETGGNRALARALAAPARTPETPSGRHGRIDLKRHALWPLTAAARALAVRYAIVAPSTQERFALVCAAGGITPADRDRLDEVQFRLKTWLLRQQLDDLDAGCQPSGEVDQDRLPDLERQSLGACLQRVRDLSTTIRDALD
jgi:DNA polymerase-3 subunit epsilon/CBS domain-containing protein